MLKNIMLNREQSWSRRLSLFFGFFIAVTAGSIARAADYDLFVNPTVNTDSAAVMPKVLMVLDNSANWSSTATPVGGSKDTKFAFEKSALQAFFSSLAPAVGGSAEYNVGLMLFSESSRFSPAGCTVSDEQNRDPYADGGGYVRYAIRPMDATNANALATLIGNLDEGDDKSNNTEYAHVLNEGYRYFKGLEAYTGIKTKSDDGQSCKPYNIPNYSPGDTGAWSSASSYLYQSPEDLSACGGNYIILIANGKADSGENNAAEDLLDELGGTVVTDPINLSPNNEEDNWADEYARFLYQRDIHTYVIEVVPNTKNNPGIAVSALYQSIANQGHGRYFGIHESDGDIATQLQDVLSTIFEEIQSVSSVYAASALPISVNVRGTNENQVYLGMFRPDANREPLWIGNLKEYELALESSTQQLKLHDRNGKLVQSPVTGFVNEDVTSYWTTDSTFWTPDPSGVGGASDSPDGDIVEKGAAAQQQRDQFDSRNIYTCIGCAANAPLSGQPFSTTNTAISAALLGADNATEREEIIEWLRGADNLNLFDSDDGDAPRPYLHGDVVHASPALINYGDGLIMAYYGDNGGLYHAVRGGKTGTGAGEELWAFVAEEFLGNIKRLRDKLPLIKVPHNKPDDPSTTADDDDENRDFFFDGGTAVYLLDNDDDGLVESADGDKVYIYLTARRGGRFIYALDVTVPASPKLLWHRSNADSSTDAAWAKLGQTWSTPKVVTLNIDASGSDVATPMLVFGAGYDPTADDALPAGNASLGEGIFVVNAVTGDVIRFFSDSDMQAIPSDVAIVDVDGDDIADVAYVGDTGGRIWRMNFVGSDPAAWTVAEFASFTASVGSDRVKFLYQPDLALFGNDCDVPKTDNTIAVMIGSGDREHPLAMSTYNEVFGTNLAETQNSFFLMKDRDYTGAISEPIVLSHLTDLTSSASTIDWTANSGTGGTNACGADVCGWYIDLESGEKVVGNPLIIGGVVTFGTSKPPATEIDTETCAGNLGVARVYQATYCDAKVYPEGKLTRYTEVPGGGLLPPPVPAVIQIDNKINYAAVLGLNVFDAPEPSTGANRIGKTFWYRLRSE
ncbi:pilus assembly protein [Rhabdochromatium marinum]|uniref:pilus assembly protein n=1 Tax=Rhabdochromatium marinum TaxID=48729 RepID=UPI0019043531|nr:PilC/PilY family type IV pilus protein [Rhabdochromatium marinum]MBK1648732.1 hypothetical protein [Rhabdochromatium marinum]